MTASLLNGEAVAQRVKMELADRAARLAAEGRPAGLGTLLVGDDAPSATYVAMKHAECAEIGVATFDEHLPASATQAEVEAVVERFNADPRIQSILVQLPLPAGMNEDEVLLRVDPAKDVDGLHPTNLGRLVMGAPGPLPCTPAGIVELLHFYEVPVEGRHVVIIGRGLTIGRPLALLLAIKRPGLQRRGHRRAHRGRGPRGPDAARRRRGRRRGFARTRDPRHGQAGRGGRGRRGQPARARRS